MRDYKPNLNRKPVKQIDLADLKAKARHVAEYCKTIEPSSQRTDPHQYHYVNENIEPAYHTGTPLPKLVGMTKQDIEYKHRNPDYEPH